MRVHSFASELHYHSHLQAIWKHLPEQIKGRSFYDPFGSALSSAAVEPDDVVMVAGYNDVERVPNNQIIYVEHGAGQRYVGIAERYALRYHGSKHPNRVVGYIAPRQEVADSWGRPAFAAGSPICDPYQLFPESPKVVVITFHFDAPQICPELRSAFDHYADKMPEIVHALHAHGYTVWGHRHPRFKRLEGYWDRLGLHEATVDEVRRHASVLIADNTSLAFELAYLMRASVTLNAPWYRRDVEHGLRFWSRAPGIQVATADELIEVIPDIHLVEVTAGAYERPYSDGEDGARAASWMTAFVSGL